MEDDILDHTHRPHSVGRSKDDGRWLAGQIGDCRKRHSANFVTGVGTAFSPTLNRIVSPAIPDRSGQRDRLADDQEMVSGTIGPSVLRRAFSRS